VSPSLKHELQWCRENLSSSFDSQYLYRQSKSSRPKAVEWRDIEVVAQCLIQEACSVSIRLHNKDDLKFGILTISWAIVELEVLPVCTNSQSQSADPRSTKFLNLSLKKVGVT
jgi:hypothetical protein